MKKVLKTKFGTAKIGDHGYYRITSGKEGNNTKLLHRLIWEDFYNCKIPKGYVIHHKNGNKTDNCILNLQLLSKSEHHSMHAVGENNSMYGKLHNNETKQKMSKKRNSTGYFGVCKLKNSQYKQGFTWVYQYYDENGKSRRITSVDIGVLEQKVKARGLLWYKLDEMEALEE